MGWISGGMNGRGAEAGGRDTHSEVVVWFYRKDQGLMIAAEGSEIGMPDAAGITLLLS